MADRFKELSTQCMKELTEVFNRMDDSNVRELLEEIKKTPRTCNQVIRDAPDASWQRILLDLG